MRKAFETELIFIKFIYAWFSSKMWLLSILQCDLVLDVFRIFKFFFKTVERVYKSLLFFKSFNIATSNRTIECMYTEQCHYLANDVFIQIDFTLSEKLQYFHSPLILLKIGYHQKFQCIKIIHFIHPIKVIIVIVFDTEKCTILSIKNGTKFNEKVLWNNIKEIFHHVEKVEIRNSFI